MSGPARRPGPGRPAARERSAPPDLAYVTVGTGVEVGLVVAGELLHGHLGAHPEMGHLPVRRHPDDDFPGCCALHGDCLEGLAAGPALEQRWGPPAARDQQTVCRAARITGYYLGQLIVTLTCTVAPACVIVGGGVSRLPELLAETRVAAADLLGATLSEHPLSDPSSRFVRPPLLGHHAGVHGALALADQVRPR